MEERKGIFEEFSALSSVLTLTVILVLIIGWIANIVKLLGMEMDVITSLLLARAFGVIFWPLGSILGFV